MRFSVALPTDRPEIAEFQTAAGLAAISRCVEASGLDAVFVTDHPAPDDRWLAGGGHHAAEPTVALAFAAAATTQLRLHTNIYVLAYRNPFLAAKALGSLDVLSGGRLIAGIAAGYLRPEFRSVGQPFDDRNDLTDELIGQLRDIWSGESFAGSREGLGGWSATGVTQLPAPEQAPPIWIGGNSSRAIRRAAELGDGWSPFPTAPGLASAAKTASITSVADLERGIARVHGLRQMADRRGAFDVCCGPFSWGAYHDGGPAEPLMAELRVMADVGVTWSTLGFRSDSVAKTCRAIERFATDVASHLR